MHRKLYFRLTLISALALLSLQGCGQKKPLHLPDAPEQNSSSQATSVSSQAPQEGKQ